jgi:hypothetical protein
MTDLRKVLTVAAFNFRQWKCNPRVIITFVLASVLCLLLTDKAVRFAMNYKATLQIMEAFVWAFGDANSIMISSLLLILLLSDMPFISPVTPYYLVRTRRSVWLWGQIVYVIAATLLYMLFILAVTMLMSMQVSFAGNMWSKTGAILAFSGMGAEIALPASIKAMIMSYPYACAGHIFFLMTLYTLFLALLMLMVNLRWGHSGGVIGVFIVSIYGLLLNPQIFMKIFKLPEAVAYKANVAVGWLSPLNQATYYMHSFGYDYLPRLWMTYAVFIILIAICFFAAILSMKKYNFKFTGTFQ